MSSTMAAGRWFRKRPTGETGRCRASVSFAFSFVLRATCHQMLFTFANTAFHDVPVTIFRIAVTAMTFPRGVSAATFSASFQENLYVVMSVEESTSSATTFPFAFAFSTSFEGVLEHSAKSANWSSSESAPIALSCAILVIDGLGGIGIGELTQVGHVDVFVSVV